jgi:hypothetical protein
MQSSTISIREHLLQCVKLGEQLDFERVGSPSVQMFGMEGHESNALRVTFSHTRHNTNAGHQLPYTLNLLTDQAFA